MVNSTNIYFISEHDEHVMFHGGIGPADVEKILRNNRAIAIKFPYHFNFSLRAKIVRIGYLFKLCLSIKPGSVVIFQHPLYARMHMFMLRILSLKKGISIICLVADIDGIKDGNPMLLKKEIRFLRNFRYFILHNANMHAWLQSFHPAVVCSHLGCFDFLVKRFPYKRSKENRIVFAGNLEKSGFLKSLDLWLARNPSLHINLYGPGVSDAMLTAKNVVYKGLHHPYTLPDLIEGSFGLIWDGDGISEPSGSLGNYMRYICHHKLSLYIVCNLPVIVHAEAGSAELIRKYNIGFTVNSLFDVEEKILQLSEADYQVMVNNSAELAKDITSGNCVIQALSELLYKIEGDKK